MHELEEILGACGLSASSHEPSPITNGFINRTFLISGAKSFILQRINKQVFRQPEVIALNLRLASDYLKFHHPDYTFPGTVPTLSGEELYYDREGYPWRLFPFIPDTYTVNQVDNAEQARIAAAGFARLSRKLSGIDVSQFQESIPHFHDLGLRFSQFERALSGAEPGRKAQAKGAIADAMSFSSLVKEYEMLIQRGILNRGVYHNDTKINNILFDRLSRQAVCVIDLDTLMPGYFIYDLGDMIRTFVSPVDEEEQDVSKVSVRKEIYEAVLDGYFSEMGDVLRSDEKSAAAFSGRMMTYIMALRALTDHLNGDIYYQIRYPGHNLVRATNQFQLLKLLPVTI